MIEMGLQYEESVKPRLEAIVRLKSTLENNFSLFTYMSKMYPFHTTINADYLISYHSDLVSFFTQFDLHESCERCPAIVPK